MNPPIKIYLICILICSLTTSLHPTLGAATRRGGYPVAPVGKNVLPVEEREYISIKIPTYLGNNYRRFYGKGPVPKKLKIIWKKFVGGGKTRVRKKIQKWYGTGWPGQGILIEKNSTLYVLFGSYNYCLWKLNANTGKTIWKHPFNNIIKGTPTVWKKNVICGSRADFFENKRPQKIKNLRCINILTGSKLWSWGIPCSDSYSRDADATGIILNDLLYIGAENGVLYKIDPDQKKKPKIISSLKLYTAEDVKNHKNNIVIESYPVQIEKNIYITAGSGHVYGIDFENMKIIWDFFIGSDINSTPVVTYNNHIIFGIEKQYIQGNGGVFNLDPAKKESECVNWFFPVGDKKFGEWEGGIIGSVSINDEYNQEGKYPALAASSAIDGNIYVVTQKELLDELTLGPDGKTKYRCPRLVWKKEIGPSISTPIFIDNYLITCSYSGKVQIFEINVSTNVPEENTETYKTINGENCIVKINEVASISLGGSIESTPVVWENKIFIGSRNGYFYCLGEN
ncbi:MAG: PQQ-binding-like beta-propeller repeat protein [Elusimicrobiota bacterium]